jgi:hypothetical protein
MGFALIGMMKWLLLNKFMEADQSHHLIYQNLLKNYFKYNNYN